MIENLYKEQTDKAGVNKYLLFTSAGDHGNVHRWLRGWKNFDLWITCYSENGSHYRDIADYYNYRRGSKFQNLYYAYHQWRYIFDQYKAIMVMDDDIILDGSDISRLFEIREKYELWLLQPAFDPRGKISHAITRVKPFSFIRFTNFVEMTCPLFRKDKLDIFMRVFDPELTGYGTDWWFLDSLGDNIEGRVAVVDSITCINPHDTEKGNVREIDRHHQSLADRMKLWEEIKLRYCIRSDEQGYVEYRKIRNLLNVRNLAHSLKICTILAWRLLSKKYFRSRIHLLRLWIRGNG